MDGGKTGKPTDKPCNRPTNRKTERQRDVQIETGSCWKICYVEDKMKLETKRQQIQR